MIVDPNKTGSCAEDTVKIIQQSFYFFRVLDLSISKYLIDKSNDLPPQPGQIKCSDIKPVQHDDATGRVIETLQQ